MLHLPRIISIIGCLYVGLCAFEGFGQVPEKLKALWALPVIHSPVSNTQDDALIIIHQQYLDIDYLTDKIVGNSTSLIESSHKRILINSAKALETLNTVYIPIFNGDIITTDIVEVKARTIKAGGEVIEVLISDMKETSLPANNPYLYGYKGKVKLFAFPNLGIGDEIEYYYTLKKRFQYDEHYTGNNTIFFYNNYPTKKYSYSLTLHKDYKVHEFPVNCAYSLKANTVDVDRVEYSLDLTDLPANKKEILENDNLSLPRLFYHLQWKKENVLKPTWEGFMSETIDDISIKKRDFFMGGKTLKAVIKEAKTKQGSFNQMNWILTEMRRALEFNNSSFAGKIEPDLYDVKQLLTITKQLDIKADILLLRAKQLGNMYRNYTKFSQFTDIYVAFQDEQNKKYLMPIWKPYTLMNEIPYDYEETEVLELNNAINDNIKVNFIQLPVSSSTDNVLENEYEVVLKGTQRNDWITITKKVKQSGQFAMSNRYELLSEKYDTKNKSFSEALESNLEDAFRGVKFQKLDILTDSTNYKDLQWTAQYQIKNTTTNDNNGNVVFMADNFIEQGYKLSMETATIRAKTAYIDFMNTQNHKITVKFDNNLKILLPKNSSKQLDNAVGNVQMNYKLTTPNSVEISYRIVMKKTKISPDEWKLYVELMDVLHQFVHQKIIATP
jgi:hypothetical protein